MNSTEQEESKERTFDSEEEKERFEQAKMVNEYLKKMDRLVKPDSKWYIVSMKWVEAWQKYSFFDYLSSES